LAILTANLERWKSQHAANVIADFQLKGIRLVAKAGNEKQKRDFMP